MFLPALVCQSGICNMGRSTRGEASLNVLTSNIFNLPASLHSQSPATFRRYWHHSKLAGCWFELATGDYHGSHLSRVMASFKREPQKIDFVYPRLVVARLYGH